MPRAVGYPVVRERRSMRAGFGQRCSMRLGVRIARKVIVPAILLILAGCEAKKVTVLEGETALEMQSSIQSVSANLPPERRQEFDQAVATIVFTATDRRLTQRGDRLTPMSISMLKGRTAHQVIEDAKLIRTVTGTYTGG